MSNEKLCPECGKERIEWSFEGRGGQWFCKPCAKFTVTLPKSAYELYAGKVKKVEKGDIVAVLAVWYPAEKREASWYFMVAQGYMK